MGSAVFSSLILLSCVGLLIGYPIDDALPAGDDTANPELAAKTAELKKQALKLLSLRGVKDLKMDVRSYGFLKSFMARPGLL